MMTDVQYENAQRAALFMAFHSLPHDFNAMLELIAHTKAIAPIIDPTIYIAGEDRLLAIEKIVRAAADFRVVASEVLKQLGVEMGTGPT